VFLIGHDPISRGFKTATQTRIIASGSFQGIERLVEIDEFQWRSGFLLCNLLCLSLEFAQLGQTPRYLLQLSGRFPERVILAKICQLPAKFSEWTIVRQGYAADFLPEWMFGIRQPLEVLGDPLRRLGRLSIFAWHAPRSAQ
jgi:hypothetical protein